MKNRMARRKNRKMARKAKATRGKLAKSVSGYRTPRSARLNRIVKKA